MYSFFTDQTSMKMEITSKELIKPSSPTPNHLKSFKLSLLDQLASESYHPVFLFYDTATLTSSDLLKKSLSETLTKYYPFAGRLQKDGITVNCADQGALFVEAKILGGGLSDFLQNLNHERQKLLLPEGYVGKESCIDKSFLAAQVTSFEGGGMAITVIISHKVADGYTAAIFLSDWAATARGEVIPSPLILAKSIPSLDLDVKASEMMWDKSATCVTKRYVFDSNKIAELKYSLAGLVENPTKVEVVTAHLYKCVISASMAKTGSFTRSTWIQVVNMRPRMKEPLPKSSIGNFSWYFTASSNNESETNLSNLVVKLKKGIQELCNGGNNVDLRNWLMGVGESVTTVKEMFDDLDVYMCSSLCRIPFYQIDFGWGVPKWVTVADMLIKNTILLFDTPNGDGIEAMVTLEEDHMRHFQTQINISYS